jgi:hypothetical protein
MAGMPVPDWRSLQEEEVEYVAPATQTEERLHALWLQVGPAFCFSPLALLPGWLGRPSLCCNRV